MKLGLAPEHCVFILTSRASDPRVTFISRAFGPAFGVDEDPVCGSAHCMLAPYWQQKLGLPEGTSMVARQVSERGGSMEIVWNRGRGTCSLIGEAFSAMKGELLI